MYCFCENIALLYVQQNYRVFVLGVYCNISNVKNMNKCEPASHKLLTIVFGK